jgi:hypothetical protein
MSELVPKLLQDDQKIEVSIRPDRTPEALLRCIQKGYVHLKFPDTQGGTDLYLPLDMSETTLNDADFEMGTGLVLLVGRLTLDYQQVKCRATIDLATMKGYGKLQRVTDPFGEAN